MRGLPHLVPGLFLLLGFAGCLGASTPATAIGFDALPLDENRTRFRFQAVPADLKNVVFEWDFGDRTPTATGAVIEHTYEHPGGEYKVSLQARRPDGTALTTTAPVLTGDGLNEAPLLYLRVDKRLAAPGEEIVFDASATVDPDGDPLFFSWDFNSPLDHTIKGSMENLGEQAYGRYPDGKPAPSEGTPEGLTPSGHDHASELEAAYGRLLRRAGIERLDGNHGAPVEERNPDFDGRLTDEGPIQVFAYPSSAIYYVHLKVVDIKGAGDEGFLRIRIDDQVPPRTNSTGDRGELEPAPGGGVVGAVQPSLSDRQGYPFKYGHPGVSTLTLSYTEAPVDEKKVGVWVCGAGAYPDCKSTSKAAMAEGESGRALTWEVGPGEAFPYTYTVYIGNMGNSIVEYEFKVDTVFDLNPWAREEAGYSVGH